MFPYFFVFLLFFSYFLSISAPYPYALFPRRISIYSGGLALARLSHGSASVDVLLASQGRDFGGIELHRSGVAARGHSASQLGEQHSSGTSI
jgi:hypothetical protein